MNVESEKSNATKYIITHRYALATTDGLLGTPKVWQLY